MRIAMKVSNNVEKITYTVVATIIATMLLLAVSPKKIVYSPYRDAFVIKQEGAYDIAICDGSILLTKHNKDRKMYSIIACRRRFEIGIFSKTEIASECGI